MNIFIADDSDLLQERLKNLLEDLEDITIIGTANNSLEAFEKISINKPDVAILDLRMPGGGGIDLLQQIKNYYSDVIVIIYTNYPYSQYRDRCLKEGADYFLHKATETEKIPEIIGNIKNRNN